MGIAMPYVRVKNKYQVTIPTSLRKAMDINEGDTLEAKVKDGQIILIPQFLSNKNIQKRKSKSSLMSMIGANKDSGLYKSAKDIDETIFNMRKEWN